MVATKRTKFLLLWYCNRYFIQLYTTPDALGSSEKLESVEGHGCEAKSIKANASSNIVLRMLNKETKSKKTLNEQFIYRRLHCLKDMCLIIYGIHILIYIRTLHNKNKTECITVFCFKKCLKNIHLHIDI